MASPNRNGRNLLHAVLTAIGVMAFCVYSHSWIDVPHLFYDIPAGIAVFGFMAQLLLDALGGRLSRYQACRFAALIAMSIVTVLRQYAEWPISGHLSCTLTVAVVQSVDRRIRPARRALYWIPVAIVLGLRLAYLDCGGSWSTWNGIAFGLVWSIALPLCRRKSTPPGQDPYRTC